VKKDNDPNAKGIKISLPTEKKEGNERGQGLNGRREKSVVGRNGGRHAAALVPEEKIR